MYRLFELQGIDWIDVVDKNTLEEIKKALIEESKKEEISSFRIDNEDTPITFCPNRADAIAYCLINLRKLDSTVMATHKPNTDSCQKVIASKPSKHKNKSKQPKKTTKKHQKRMMRKKHIHYR